LFNPPTRVVSEKSKPQYLEPLLLNLEPWAKEQSNSIDFRHSDSDNKAEILFYNTGSGQGYSVCLDCGRVESTSEKLTGHRRLRGGKDPNGESLCASNSIREHVILGSRFRTDFIELRLKNADGSFVNDTPLAYSLGVVLTRSLAEYLAIEESELGFGVKKYKGYQSIFIYDTARGGAGYASLFSRFIKEILDISYKSLASCDCQNVCTKCLIDRSTQWHMENLDRHLALNWLKEVKEYELPKELTSGSYKVYSVYGSLKDELLRLDYSHGIRSMKINANTNLDEWNVEEINWLNQLLKQDIKIEIAVEGDITFRNTEDKLTLFYLSARGFVLRKGRDENYMGFPISLSVVTNNGAVYTYISKGPIKGLDQNWAVSTSTKTYLVENLEVSPSEPFVLPDFESIASSLFESRIGYLSDSIGSNDIAQLMIDNINDFKSFNTSIKKSKYTVTYTDKFNRSEFSLRLMIQFIESIQEVMNIDVSSLLVTLNERDFKADSYPFKLTDFYKELDDYEYDLVQISRSTKFDVKVVRSTHRLPHYRMFEFVSDDCKFNIRIDGGIAHGFKPLNDDLSLGNENSIFEIKKSVFHDIIYNLRIEDLHI